MVRIVFQYDIWQRKRGGGYLWVWNESHLPAAKAWLCLDSSHMQYYFSNNWSIQIFFSYFQVSLRIQSECGKMQTRITPNTDTFYAVKTLTLKRFVIFSNTNTEIWSKSMRPYVAVLSPCSFSNPGRWRFNGYLAILMSDTKMSKLTLFSFSVLLVL